jgi:uncharacterized protein (DUF1330 family)
MAAYVIADVDVKDAAKYDEYRPIAARTVAQYGGRFLVRGGAVEPLEGGWTPKRVVVLEFPSMEQAQRWYRSPEYAPGIALRQAASVGRVILVEGAPPA